MGGEDEIKALIESGIETLKQSYKKSCGRFVIPETQKGAKIKNSSFLIQYGFNDDEENLKRSCTAEVDAAAEDYLALPPQPAESMFDFVYGNVPKSLEVQRTEVAERSHRKMKSSDA